MRTLRSLSLLGVCLLVVGVSYGSQEQKQPTASELSKNETPGKAIIRTFDDQEYEFRSAGR
jgi:hypothetical protein